MKAFALAAAALAGLTLAGAADAQVVKHTTVAERPNGTVVKKTTVRPAYGPRAYHRPYYRPAWHPGWRGGYHRHCTTHWYHGRRVTRCW